VRRNETQKERAKSLRTNATPAEQKLWAILRAHRFEGVKFTRQVQFGSYILDFAARSAKLAIEVDGDTHSRQVDYDAARTSFFEAQGYRVLRFTNAEVMGNIEGVAAAIATALRAVPSPNPLPGGERA
jgi:very-short-patch-repair endonuclease